MRFRIHSQFYLPCMEGIKVYRSVLILIVLQEKFFQIIFPLLPFWMPWKRVADVQTTLRVHLYCPSMPFYPWENTGEHILKSFAELLILYCICGWLFIYWIIWWIIKPLLYPGSIFWPVFFLSWQGMRIQLSGLLEEKVIIVGVALNINHGGTYKYKLININHGASGQNLNLGLHHNRRCAFVVKF